MEPAPIAIITRTFAIGDVKPSAGIIGAIIADVVIIATVEAPMAVFSSAAIINGRNTPTPRPKREVLSASAIGSFCRIAPKEPPAPVIARIRNTFCDPLQRIFFFFFRNQSHCKKDT